MNKLIASLSMLFFSTAWSVLILMKAWGLQVESWGWLITGVIGSMILLMINLAIAKGE